MMPRYSFRATVWRHAGDAAWHFATLPHHVADEIEAITAPTRRGFGSVRVSATIGSTTWETSLFPDTKAASYVLPVKRPVREREGIADGDLVTIGLTLTDPAR